jgi:hypothetical protein
MLERVTSWALSNLAEGAIKAGAKLAPHREVDVFPHRNVAQCRNWWHLDADVLPTTGTAWRVLCIAFGGWTVDVCWRAQAEAAA